MHLVFAMDLLGASALPTPKLQASEVKQLASPYMWGDDLSLELSIAGEGRWASADHWFWGGRLGVGLNIRRFSLHAELSIHSYALQTREEPLPAYIPLVTPSFYVGYRLPLGDIERWLSLSVRLGTETEAFVLESTYTVDPGKTEGPAKSSTTITAPLYWGIMLGLQLNWQFARAWSVFLRPSAVFYPGGLFKKQSTDLIEKTSLSTFQVSALVGIQVRL